jgi:hypothetical protein
MIHSIRNHRLLWSVISISFILSGSSFASGNSYFYHENDGREGFRLDHADQQEVAFTFSISQFSIEQIEINGEMMDQIMMPGTFTCRNFGLPNLPVRGWHVALPRGATA